MASTAGLVPITRAFLATYYDKYPYSSCNEDLDSITDSLKKQYTLMSQEYEKIQNDLLETLAISAPHKIDENMWKNREQLEEILHLLDEASWPEELKELSNTSKKDVVDVLRRLATLLKGVLKEIETFQTTNSERIYNMVLTYMPQDFRCSLIKQQRERSERKRQAEVEALVSAGGSIGDKFSLLWKQQMERRRQLAQLGSSSGIYKQVVKYLVGVPVVLLDFVKQLNDHQGPMEEQRARYGPPLYQLTILVNSIRVFIEFWWLTVGSYESRTDDMVSWLDKAVGAYTSEFRHYLIFIGKVFENSPFLITAEEAGLTENNFDEYEETTIPAGKVHEVAVRVEYESSIVAWDFRLTYGKDVGFHVEFISEGGQSMPMVPYKRYDANQPYQGNFPSPFVGLYKLVWDNTYSTFSRKTVRHKLDVIPPVAPQSPETVAVESSQ